MTEEPSEEQAEVAVAEVLDPGDLVLSDPADERDVVAVLDAHDTEQILMEIQRRALRVWVYDIPGDRGQRRRELSYKGVRDIVGLMNRTGRVKIGTIPETLKMERLSEDIGHGGPEPLIRATIFARDEVTGQAMPGIDTEPLYLKLTDAKANAKRRDGQEIPADNRVFNDKAETIAANKAVRNALRTFIPEEAAQVVIAMYSGESARVLRIQTVEEARAEELPPPLTDEAATKQKAEARELYSEIRELGAGRGKLELTPALFHSYLTRAEHSHERLGDLLAWLQTRREEIAAKFNEEGDGDGTTEAAGQSGVDA